MRRFSLALGLLIALTLIPEGNAAPQFGVRQRGQDRVCVYQDVQFRGWEQCYAVGDEVRSLGSQKKAISSVRVQGRARLQVWEDPDFHGHMAEFSSDVPDLNLRALAGGHTWNDQIESIRVVSDNDYNSSSSNSRNTSPVFGREEPRQQINEGICVYDRPDYRGREQCFNAGTEVSDLARAGNWSDKIQSIRVVGRTAAVLYRDIGFRGESVTIDRDVPDLRQMGGRWDRQISSIAIESERGFPGRGRARGRFGR